MHRIFNRWAVALVMLAPLPGLADDEAPDMALLEFLGSFTTDNGEVVDPTGWIADDEYVEVAAQIPQAEDVDDERSK
ncbi:MAG: hypothetical protein H6978_03475 [Gammaproteobacteria bacterium]|nr:hypothetical protein [Gammaproteobacteria bacterium]